MRLSLIGETGLEHIITGENGYTFSNELHVPKGPTVAAPLRGIQDDEDVYQGSFDPKRPLQSDLGSARQNISIVTPGYLTFGLGKYACSGR